MPRIINFSPKKAPAVVQTPSLLEETDLEGEEYSYLNGRFDKTTSNHLNIQLEIARGGMENETTYTSTLNMFLIHVHLKIHFILFGHTHNIPTLRE